MGGMIRPQDVTACLITTLPEYPPEVLQPIQDAGFADILIYTNCPSVAGRLPLFQQAQTPFLFTQDDDALCPLDFLLGHADRTSITTVMHPGHIEFYGPRRHCIMNWGATFPRAAIESLEIYSSRFDRDDIFHREFDRIFTGLNFPQLRLPYQVINLPRSADPDRISQDPKHFEWMAKAEERLESLLRETPAASDIPSHDGIHT